MALVYRTDGAWGSGKGADLTPAEVDGNFYDLDGRVTTLEDNPPTPTEISDITVNGNQFTVHLEDGTTFGPFTLPTATFNDRGDFTDATTYFANDIIRAPGDGLYLVLQQHVSTAPFDSADGNSAADYYQLILSEASVVTAVAGTTFTPALTNAGAYLRCTNAGGCAVTIPGNTTVAFPVGTELHFRQVAAGVVSFTGAGGVTINGVSGFDNITAGQGAVATLKKVGTNEWDLFGYLAEASSGSA